jgi:LacI family transcriptional regulator
MSGRRGDAPFVSLKDVAARTGVSFQTVSKILKGSPVNVSDATRARVTRSAAELGYVPNAVARGLVTQSTCAVGILAGDLADWALSQFVVGAEREARSRGHAVLITTARAEAGDAAACVRVLIERRVEGIVAAAPQLEHDPALAGLLRGIPTVSIHHVDGGGVSLVGSDHRATGRLATDHLVRLGHRSIATITGPPDRRVVSSRSHGYREALEAAGLEVVPGLLEAADWTPEGGHQATLRLMERIPGVTALFVQNDMMAMGALSALHRLGRSVPGDVAVVGCDDLPMVVHTVPPLTTVRVPFTETGARAVSLLLEQIRQGRLEPERVLLPVRLVVRGSCGGGSADG